MKFFVDKQIAITNTRYFIFLFILNVTIISVLNGLLFHFLIYNSELLTHPLNDYKGFVFGTLISVCVFLWFTGESIKKFSNGNRVAASVGAKQLRSPFQNDLHQRYYNIVEEMAIASGVPVPAIFVIENESSINAFAAGASPRDAAIVITSGALDHLTRDELQAVVGHEFSHILFEDMSLNGRIAGAVNGFMFFVKLAERQFSNNNNDFSFSTSRNRNDRRGKAYLMAIGLWIVGSVGFLLGRIMQSQISKQREYLADASSVQFTRNPRALASALAKISKKYGSAVYRVDRYELGHFFFADVLNWHHTRWFNTHPSMEDRIFRVVGVSDTVDTLYKEPQSASKTDSKKTNPQINLHSPLSLLADLPLAVKEEMQSAQLAKVNILSIVISLNDRPDRILEVVKNHFPENIQMIQRNLNLIKSNLAFRYMIFQIALNPLKSVSETERLETWNLVKKVMESDSTLTFKEALILYLLKSELKSVSKNTKKSQVGSSLLQLLHWASGSESLTPEMKADVFSASPGLFESTKSRGKIDWQIFKQTLQTLETLSFKQRTQILRCAMKYIKGSSPEETKEVQLLLSQGLGVAVS